MPDLTFFKYSILLDNRQWQTHACRFGVTVILLIILFFFHMASRVSTATGMRFFAILTYFNLIIVAIAGVTSFASAVSDEKDENTLPLILLTGINTFSLLLSKSSSKMFEGLFLISLQLPFVMLAVTLGGVSPFQILASFLCLVSFIFFAANFGLLCSVITKKKKQAMGLAQIIILPSLLIPDFWIPISPFYRITRILSTGYNGGIVGIYEVLAFSLGIIAFIISNASFNFFSRWQMSSSKPSSEKNKKGRKKPFRLFKPSRVWYRYPLAWKGFYFYGGGKFGIIIRCLIVLALLAFIFYGSIQGRATVRNTGLFMCFSGVIFYIINLCGFADRFFKREILDKTLPSILILPYRPADLLRQGAFALAIMVSPSFIYLSLGIIVFFEAGPWALFWVITLLYFSPLFAMLAAYSALSDRSWKRSLIMTITTITCIVIFPLLLVVPILGIWGLLKMFRARLIELAAED